MRNGSWSEAPTPPPLRPVRALNRATWHVAHRLLSEQQMNQLAGVIALIVGVAALYLARAVLVPIALAMLLTFMVYPIVAQLTRLGLGRRLSGGLGVTMLV